uniref:ADP,ATP carrier protein n=1 Tax=Hemiselmis andersenii TaxID=464988 RepID=A0A6T8NIL3_HEMAN|mmetsp:Transcript_36467/g.85091  ORF Transcript_36467/g.85091 Transcript_36467/m.85091 type:complete len:332 (+) Transcript_36467:91-1086(+)
MASAGSIEHLSAAAAAHRAETRGEAAASPDDPTVKDGMASGALRGAIRTVLVLKVKSLIKVSALKAWRPGNKGSLFLLKKSARTRGVSLQHRARDILKNEGLVGIIQRTAPALATNLLASTTLFGVYSLLHADNTFKKPQGDDISPPTTLTFIRASAAGGAAGAAHAVVTAPSEVFLQWVQQRNMPVSQRKLLPKIDPSLLRPRAIARDAVGFGVFFGVFESVKRGLASPIRALLDSLSPEPSNLKTIAAVSSTSLASGGAAGVAYTFMTFPSEYASSVKPKKSVARHLQLLRAFSSRHFVKAFGRAAVGGFVPNAASFVALDLLAMSLDD